MSSRAGPADISMISHTDPAVARHPRTRARRAGPTRLGYHLRSSVCVCRVMRRRLVVRNRSAARATAAAAVCCGLLALGTACSNSSGPAHHPPASPSGASTAGGTGAASSTPAAPPAAAAAQLSPAKARQAFNAFFPRYVAMVKHHTAGQVASLTVGAQAQVTERFYVLRVTVYPRRFAEVGTTRSHGASGGVGSCSQIGE